MHVYMSEMNYVDAAAALSDEDLEKNIVTGIKIMRLLANPYKKDGSEKVAYRNPGVQMWKNASKNFADYLYVCGAEQKKRGGDPEDNMKTVASLSKKIESPIYMPPAWVNNKFMLARVVRSHRKELYSRNKEEYSDYAYSDFVERERCCPDCRIYWPSHVLERIK